MAQFTHFFGVKSCFKILTTRTTKTMTTMIAIGYLLANDAIVLLNLVDSPSVPHLGKISQLNCDKQTMTMPHRSKRDDMGTFLLLFTNKK